MTAYYNENNKYAAQWLRNLIDNGVIADGVVDERSIKDVSLDDLLDFNQCHFFAGIGGWSYALRLAGVSDESKVWTGSCPCQPFSQAGQRKGVEDERNLWPEFHVLIAERNPPVVFGEQVASKDGRKWFAGVRLDLEALGYAVGGADLCAASVKAPHVRQRLYWTADSNLKRRKRLVSSKNSSEFRPWGWGGKKDLQSTLISPFQQSNLWPQPLLRKGDDGVSKRMAKLHAYGNAIVPQLAAEFIIATGE